MIIAAGKGFSLIEVLISIFILSIGVAGAISMQLSALRASQQSGFQAIALQTGAEIADKVRANAGHRLDDADNPFLHVDFQGDSEPLMPGTLCYGLSADCDVLALAMFDIYEAEGKVRKLLPAGRIKICRDSLPWDERLKKFQWTCTSSGASSPIVIKLGWREQHFPSSTSTLESPDGAPRIVLLVRS